MTWLFVLNMFGLALAVVFVLESLRRKPMWLRPEKALSPRQRRWYGFGMILFFSGNTITGLNRAGGTELYLLPAVLMALALIVLIAAFVKGPTGDEIERRARERVSSPAQPGQTPLMAGSTDQEPRGPGGAR